MSSKNVIQTLTERGFISQLSDPGLEKILEKPVVLYAGFDPTARSLHIGNLLQIMLLAWFQRYGHKPIALVGGATAMIGDPSGKNEERNLLSEEVIRQNQEGIQRQLQHFLDFSSPGNGAVMVNNADWIGRFSFIEFLRDIGKHFRIGTMIGKESVRKRLNSEAGMSFTEFSYQLLQAYDFLHLYRNHNCILQVGGDDQWGNITAGIELTRKLANSQVYGLTSPLLTTAGGRKFGKTESGTIWLDAGKTSPYEFYQYWLRTDDRDVINLLKRFTYLPLEEIAGLEKQMQQEPEKRTAQKTLAAEVTALVHGPEQLGMVRKASEILFGAEIKDLSDKELSEIFRNVPSSVFTRQKLAEGISLIDALLDSGLCKSRGEAKKLIKSGGAYVNNNRITQLDYMLTGDSLASESILVLRSGKKKYHLVRFE